MLSPCTLLKSIAHSACILVAALCLAQEEPEKAVKPASYQSKGQVALSFTTVEDRNSDQMLTYPALVGSGPRIIFSELNGYISKPSVTGESAILRRNLVDAHMDFWLHPTKLKKGELTAEMAAQHFAYITAKRVPGTEIEILSAPQPGERKYDRYFTHRPFELAYSEKRLNDEGQAEVRVIHENWMVYDGYFLAVRLVCMEKNYPALLKEARRIWKNARLDV